MSTERASNTRATRATRGQKLLLLASLLTMVFLATGQKEPEYKEDCCAVAEILGDEDRIVFVHVLQLLAGRKRDRVIITPPSATLKPGKGMLFPVRLASGLEATFKTFGASGVYLDSTFVDPFPTDNAALDVFLKPTSELPPPVKDNFRFSIAGYVFSRKDWKESPDLQKLLKAGEKVTTYSTNGAISVQVIASRDTDPKEIYTDRVTPAWALVWVDLQEVLADLGLTGN